MGPVRNTAPSYPRAPSRPARGAAPPRGWDRGGAWTLTQDGPGWGLQGGREGTRAAGGMKTGTEVGAESRAGRSQLPRAGAGPGLSMCGLRFSSVEQRPRLPRSPTETFLPEFLLRGGKWPFSSAFSFFPRSGCPGRARAGLQGFPALVAAQLPQKRQGPSPRRGHTNPPHSTPRPLTRPRDLCVGRGV